MSYALSTLWYERARYFPGVLAVGFSALLIALQGGLLLGLFSITSIPIDMSNADIWVGHPEVPAVDMGRTIPESWQSYVALPEVEHMEPYLQGFAYWDKPTGGVELCMVIGSRLGPDSLGTVSPIGQELKELMSQPGTVVVDESELDRLGVDKVGDTAEISGRRVRIVGVVHGLKSLTGPYIFASFETARQLLRPPPDYVTFILARCHNKEDAPKVVEKLKKYHTKIAAFTAEDFSFRSRWHWLTKTKAGVALGLAALLGLLVGAVVTYQTLRAATVASFKEYAVLRALGIPRWRISMTVFAQAFWVGLIGVTLAIPFIFLLARLGNRMGAKVILPWELLAVAVGVTLLTAMGSGVLALRSLRQIEPVTLLR